MKLNFSQILTRQHLVFGKKLAEKLWYHLFVMPESATDPALNPYISPQEDKDNAGRLKSDIAHQLYNDIRREAGRQGLEVGPDDSPETRDRKNRALKELFNQRSANDLPDYQAAQIVDMEGKATRDPLTGLLNRRGFESQFNLSLWELSRSSQSILFLIIDLDYFKKINDVHGHLVGDETLKHLARALADAVEIDDLVCRWGGEEFVVAVMPTGDQPHNSKNLLAVAERIRQQVIEKLAQVRYPQVNDQNIPITLSIGATLTNPDDTFDTACKRADENLYRAKNNGRNQSFGDDGRIILASPPGGRPKTVSR